MEINRRALYNSLRMNWVLDPTLEVEPWQVEDYRAMPVDNLFERLEDKGLYLDKMSFKAYAETVDSPEDLTDALLADATIDIKMHDQVYLLIFELWRRLLPEKPCVSVFCDEIDHQIYLYDRQQVQNVEAIQDALANLQVILDENVDNGADPLDAFDFLDAGCANDVESFLYDFISDQIDNHNDSYANELLEGFGNYMRDENWFDFLRARLIASSDPREANHLIELFIDDKTSEPDLELNLEVLAFLVCNGDEKTFSRLVRKAAKLLQIEEDFQALVSVCIDFYHRLDRESIEKALQDILNRRKFCDAEKIWDPRDPDLTIFLKYFPA